MTTVLYIALKISSNITHIESWCPILISIVKLNGMSTIRIDILELIGESLKKEI